MMSRCRTIAPPTLGLSLLLACGTETGQWATAPAAFTLRSTAHEVPQYSDWSEPVNLGPLVNSASTDIEVAISRDGLSLYLASNRPGGSGSFDIWVSRRASIDAPWEAPRPLGGAVNSGFREQGPFLSTDGHRLFFFSNRPGGYGGLDLWMSRRRDARDDFGWEAPVNLGGGVNSDANESLPVFFEDDGSGRAVLYFTTSRGGNDIFMSTLERDETFGPAVPVPELNSARRDRVQAIRRDGLELFLGSDRPGPVPEPFDLWVATRRSTRDPWSAPVKLGPAISGAADEPSAALSFDGTTLYFVSDRAGGSGNLDVWMSTRRR